MDSFSCERNIVSASQLVVTYLQFSRFSFRKSDSTLFGTDQIRCPEEFCISCIVCSNDHRANGSNKINRSSVVVKANSLRSWGCQSMLWTVFTGAISYSWQMGDWGLVTKLRGGVRGWGSGERPTPPPPPPSLAGVRGYQFEFELLLTPTNPCHYASSEEWYRWPAQTQECLRVSDDDSDDSWSFRRPSPWFLLYGAPKGLDYLKHFKTSGYFSDIFRFSRCEKNSSI